MAKIQERIKTDYKAMEESHGMVQQCEGCKIRYRSHEVRPLCSDCEEQQQATQAAVEEAPIAEESSTENTIETTIETISIIEEAHAVSEPSQTQETTIHDLIIEKQSRCEGKPSQNILALLLKEEEEEGPHNDGLLAAYIKEAHETLEDLVLLINEERLYRRVLAGETVHVQVERTGKAFSIRTAENNTTGLPAYDIFSPSGKIEKRGIILDKTALRNWIYGLVEVD